jgi:hypothetical protein
MMTFVVQYQEWKSMRQLTQPIQREGIVRLVTFVDYSIGIVAFCVRALWSEGVPVCYKHLPSI